MRNTLYSLVFMLYGMGIQAQAFRHYDFLGAGHSNEVTVTASSSDGTNAEATIDGFDILNPDQLKEASRFLAQATFGADYSTIQMTAAMGYEAWLEEQFNLPRTPIMDEMVLHAKLYEQYDEIVTDRVASYNFGPAWITQNLTAADLLRQRLTFNWSQIMVINDNSDLFEDVGQSVGGFYDMLGSNSFNNFYDLLMGVTLSPAMGNFLSHFNNPKADPSRNIHPDENYAREIMQLFSIGLWELNPDGTRKYDSNGQFIPTYTNADIKEFAQVFTGLGSGVQDGKFGVGIEETEIGIHQAFLNPMKMYDAWHDKSEKKLLNGVSLPANQTGTDDINQTILHLVEHPNTAPFISKSLIKMMTTSNPSPAYVLDVAKVFDPTAPNNLQEVIKAILLHPEARNCTLTDQYTFGKLREPLVRMTNFLRAFALEANPYGDYAYPLDCFADNTGQAPMKAPSVFNFFLPDYQPPGPINQNYLVAPEFQILNAPNAIGILNDINFRVIKTRYLEDKCIGDDEYEEELDDEERDTYIPESFFQLDATTEVELAETNPQQLVERLDILLANGLLSEDTKGILLAAMNQLDHPVKKFQMAVYLILLSPDYAILK